MKNGYILTKRIIANQHLLTTVAGPQKLSFRKIKRKRRAKPAAQGQIQRFPPQVDEVVTENEKTKKTAKKSLKNVIQKSKTANRKHRK